MLDLEIGKACKISSFKDLAAFYIADVEREIDNFYNINNLQNSLNKIAENFLSVVALYYVEELLPAQELTKMYYIDFSPVN